MIRNNNDKGNLILTRNIGQTFRIFLDEKREEYIEVSVVGVNGIQVRHSIRAPLKYAIFRNEILERMEKEQL